MADGFTLYPPGGRSAGAIRVQDRVRPLRPVRAIVDRALAEMGGLLTDLETGKLARLVTVEGEFAAAITLAARRRADGRRVERTLGLIFAEDFYTRIDGIMQLEAELEGFRGRVRAMTTTLSLGLGAQRRRRYLYAPPPGWQGVSRTFRSDWVPPEHPRQQAMIQVLHAKPMRRGAGLIFDRVVREDLGAGLTIEVQDPVDSIGTTHGLGGVVSSLSGRYPGGPPLHVVTAALTDERFMYIARLESGDDGFTEHRGALAALVDSIRPLPAPQEEPVAGGLDLHWAT